MGDLPWRGPVSRDPKLDARRVLDELAQRNAPVFVPRDLLQPKRSAGTDAVVHRRRYGSLHLDVVHDHGGHEGRAGGVDQ